MSHVRHSSSWLDAAAAIGTPVSSSRRGCFLSLGDNTGHPMADDIAPTIRAAYVEFKFSLQFSCRHGIIVANSIQTEVSVSLLRDSIELITAYPGALVYHLVTLFAIQLIAGVALGHWQRQRDDSAMRLLIMGLGLFIARALLMLLAALGSLGLISSTVVFPPLERFLHLATSLLVLWAFLPVLQQNPRIGTVLLLITALLAAGTYAAFAPLWARAEAQGATYVGHWQERVWDISTMATLGMALVAGLVWRGSDWSWLVCLLGLWVVGHFLQLVAPAPAGNAAGWIRLTNMIALPLLAALVYRRALRAAASAGPEETEIDSGALGVLEAVRRIRAEGELQPGLELAARSIATTVDADMALVGLIAPGSSGRLRVMARHPTIDALRVKQEQTVFLTEHPLLAAAARRQHLQRALGDGSVSQMRSLYGQLGFDSSGPLLVQPLIASDGVVGLILAGNPASQREWDTRDERILQAIALVLGPAITGDRTR